MASGIEMAMIRVLRQLPKNRRIMAAVRHAAVSASRMTPWTAARTKMDWSNSGVIFNSGGSAAAIADNADRTSCTIVSVDAEPVL
jgi:hypothetical protein